ncbi:MAG: hypothetical protein HY554_13710 [Elusimicrobia bacterium]|nr:hypothetical protein [Elusimicrobiota bacterium]
MMNIASLVAAAALLVPVAADAQELERAESGWRQHVKDWAGQRAAGERERRDYEKEMRALRGAEEELPPIFSPQGERRREEASREPAGSADDERLELTFADDNARESVTMTMSRKTFERYAAYYGRWNDDEVLRRITYGENSALYLGKMNGRTAAAITDVVVTALDRDGRIYALPLTGGALLYLKAAMAAWERLDSSNFDLGGSDVDDFFRDRFGRRRSASSGVALGSVHPYASKPSVRRVRIRIRASNPIERSKVGLVYSAQPRRELPLGGWRFEAGAEGKPAGNKDDIRVWTGITKTY